MRNYEVLLPAIQDIVRERVDSQENLFGKGIITHFELTAKFAAEIAEREGADIQVVTVAAWLHDIATITDYQAYYREHHIHGMYEAEKILSQYDVDISDIEKVKRCILQHRGSTEVEHESPVTPEAICVADADAIAHMCDVPGLLHLAYGVHNVDRVAGRDFVRAKLQRSFNKMSDKSRVIYRHIYDSALHILDMDIYYIMMKKHEVYCHSAHEIFRGRLIDDNHWVEGDGIHYPKSINYKGTCWIDGGAERANDWLQVDPATVGRYTGIDDSTVWTDLGDNNGDGKWGGRPIFEGDIISASHGGEVINTSYVVFEDGAYWCKLISGHFISECETLFEQSCECWLKVIGNIHDNPELLEAQENASQS